ncbi:MAG: hypothetical protein WCJ71_05810 [Candidatus Omnitrophota bacterium]
MVNRKRTKEGYVVTIINKECPTEKLTLTYSEDVEDLAPYVIDNKYYREYLNTFTQLFPKAWVFSDTDAEHAALSLIAENIPQTWYRNHVAIVRHMYGGKGKGSYSVGATVIRRTVV